MRLPFPRTILCRLAAAAVFAACAPPPAEAINLRSTPLMDGERVGVSGGLLNNWGGAISSGNTLGVARQTAVTHSGSYAYRVNLGTVPDGGFTFFQAFSSALNSPGRRSTRDLTPFQSLDAQFRNDTGAPLDITIELKDYRDSSANSATRTFAIAPGAGWTAISAPLDLSSGWQVTGSPQLDQTYAVSFLAVPRGATAIGSYYVDDVRLVEPGPPLDPTIAPIAEVAEFAAHRTFTGLWGSRSRASGLVPNSSDNANLGALNTTSGLVWALPSAVRRGWVSQAEADQYMATLTNSINTNRDQTQYLPSRFLDLHTGAAGAGWEASPVDASFLALAMHQYESQPGVDPAVAAGIDAAVNRFDFSAFGTPGGWRLNYTQSGGFSGGTYNGYTNEGKVISLAAELSDSHHVPLATYWNTDTYRTRTYLADAANTSVVYGDTNFRSPFEQALLNLFVDVSDRGLDTYPQPFTRVNGWENFVRFQADSAAYLAQQGRPNFFQPDAGQGGPPSGYKAYSLYNLFPSGSVTNQDLFMPWSAALAALSGDARAQDALRFLLNADMLGPLGLADSARWATGAPSPSSVAAQQDNWNLALSLMALLRLADGAEGGARFLADLPQLSAALDTVYGERLPGDYNADGAVNQRDYDSWLRTYAQTADLSADGDGDRRITAADYTIWRDHLAGPAAGVPEPTGATLAAALGALVARGLKPRRVR